jgi:transposase-like protein
MGSPPAPAQPVARIIACPRCGERYRALSGQRARFQCARCQQVFEVIVP